jgi:hypothetical protein
VTGFARSFSAHTLQKNPGIHKVFPGFSISSERKIPLAKLLCTVKGEIFVSDEAAGAGILAMYSEYRQRSPARKDLFYGDRIPILPALKGKLYSL